MSTLKTEATFSVSERAMYLEELLTERQIITLDDVDKLKKLDKIKLQESLASTLRITNYQMDLQQAILLEYFVTGFWWAKQKLILGSKICAFMSLLNMVLRNLQDYKLSVADNMLQLRKVLLGIGPDPLTTPFGLTMEDVHRIMGYLTTDIFQHYKLYEFMANNTQDTVAVLQKLTIETAKDPQTPYPPPLEEAIVEGVYPVSSKTLGADATICPTSSQAKLEEPASP